MIIQTSPLIYLGIHAIIVEGPGWSGIGIIQYIWVYCPVHTFEVKGGGGHFPKGIPGRLGQIDVSIMQEQTPKDAPSTSMLNLSGGGEGSIQSWMMVMVIMALKMMFTILRRLSTDGNENQTSKGPLETLFLYCKITIH